MMNIIRESSKSTNCISGSSVCWIKWKDLLSRHFKVPTKFKINSYHVFRATSEEKGILYVKELSSSSTELRFDFNIADAAPCDATQLNDPQWTLSWIPLSETPSRQHGTRKGYLMHKVIDAYYANNDDVRSAFFASGD